MKANDRNVNVNVNVNESSHVAEQSTEEITEIEEDLEAIDERLKRMKNGIDVLESKKASKSFWSVSVLSKKWQNWRKKNNKKTNEHVMPVVHNKSIKCQYRETQSEIADYGYGRRSCDVDPRFSLDVGRVSFDDPRYSFDEPRASWDGYMIGRSFPRLPPMVEDVAPPVVVVPQGVSLRRVAFLMLKYPLQVLSVTMEEMEGGLRVPSSIGGERELARDSNSNSLRDDCSETFELRFGDGEKKEGKKTRRWRWKLWGFIQRRGNKDDEEEDDRYSRVNGVARSYSGSWEHSGTNKKVFRSNSSVSWRNSSIDMKKSSSEMNRLANGKNRRVGGDEFVLERNRSARHSPNHADSGLLRFYLTPLRGSRRSRPTINGVARSYSGSWEHSGTNKKVFRSNSSVSWRNSSIDMKKSSSEMNRLANGKNRRVGGDEFVLERNRSARHSPNHADSGLLRFYLTPLRGSRRSRPTTRRMLKGLIVAVDVTSKQRFNKNKALNKVVFSVFIVGI
ncbi:hypothetical protein CTI12_AA376860 [Artemisia annua]|uniref:Uncharacterized protein n=1 Tax=Artemisia annua TaxID=35608 RepID=A0A2U1M758_ARTAN|nr:hypothetical protein CTI12_AA376860 [Artemisia annua]